MFLRQNSRPAMTESEMRTRITAIVTLGLLVIWLGMVYEVFQLVEDLSAKKTLIDTSLYGLLGTIFGTQTVLMTGAVGYWVGTSAGAKTSGDALAESNKNSTAAIAQLARAGAPPPAPPTGSVQADAEIPPPGKPPAPGA